MAEGRLRRKRRQFKGCPNPLFVQWVEEWRDEARNDGSKTQYTYTKALNSLRKYPLPLSSGQEAKLLNNIGEKLAKRLDKRLAEHRANGGDCGQLSADQEEVCPKRPKLAGHGAGPSGDEEGDSGKSEEAKKREKRKHAQREYVPEYRSGPYAIITALYEAQQKPNWVGYLTKAQLMSEAQPHCDKSFTIPDDGTYYTAWSSTSSLIRKGLVDKRSCPAKFRLTDAGIDMAVRLLRGSAFTSGPSASPSSPHPVSHDTHLSPSTQPHHSHMTGGESSDCSDLDGEDDPPCDLHMAAGCSWGDSGSEGSRSCVLPELRFWYVNSSGDCVHSKDDAMVSINEGMSVGFLIKCSRMTLESCSLTYSIDHKRPAEAGFVFAYLDNTHAPDECVPPLEMPGKSSGAGSAKSSCDSVKSSSHSSSAPVSRPCPNLSSISITLSDSDSSDIEILPLADRIRGEGDGKAHGRSEEEQPAGRDKALTLTPAQMAGRAALRRMEMSGGERAAGTRRDMMHKKTGKRKRREKVGETDDEDEDFPVFPQTSGTRLQTSALSQSPVSPPPVAITRQGPTARVLVSHSVPPMTGASTSRAGSSLCSFDDVSTRCDTRPPGLSSGVREGGGEGITDLGKPLFKLKPGTFEVVLCVDNAESTASRKSSSQFRGILLQELSKNGVQFHVRKLNIGDFLWVAKEKVTPVPGMLSLPPSREVVLEYIVERKRMDDLAGSIVDGRYREQKFRLKHCGVRHPVYLVEEFKNKLHLKLPEKTLEQAIANTQIIDGFLVNRTTDVRESVAYLTIMTRYLQQHYSGSTILAYTWDAISQQKRSESCTSEHTSSSKAVHSVEFQSFNEASVKNKALTVYEMFGRHLMQVPGLSAERAAAILEHYPTISHLREAYQKCKNDSERELLIASLSAGPSKKKMGIKVGQSLCSLYWRGTV